jgi:hypothetical protein
VESFYAAVRKATPQVRILAERYGADVSFSFDSNGRSVWVMALFGKGVPPALSAVVRKYGDVFSGRSEDCLPPSTLSGQASRRREHTAPPQGERDLRFETPNIFRDGPSRRLRTGPAGLLKGERHLTRRGSQGGTGPACRGLLLHDRGSGRVTAGLPTATDSRGRRSRGKPRGFCYTHKYRLEAHRIGARVQWLFLISPARASLNRRGSGGAFLALRRPVPRCGILRAWQPLRGCWHRDRACGT